MRYFGVKRHKKRSSLFCINTVLVLNEVDKLSREAQHSLRRTMEKYSSSCRLILCCNSSSKVTDAVRSRCLNIRVNAPTQEEVSLFILIIFLWLNVENMQLLKVQLNRKMIELHVNFSKSKSRGI